MELKKYINFFFVANFNQKDLMNFIKKFFLRRLKNLGLCILNEE